MVIIDLCDDMINYFECPVENICTDLQQWDAVIQNHLLKMFNLSEGQKLPSFMKSMKWINVSRPLSLEDFKDRVVIVDFFTYCCINCEHILPYLKEIEEEFHNNPGIAVIGVHSPKFPNEKSLRNVQDAVLRNNITHPVLHDENNSLWTEMGIFCWPTILIIGPNQLILFSLVGENQISKLKHLIYQTLDFIKWKEIHLTTAPLFTSLSCLTDDTSQILRYPTYMTHCGENIIISDTGHNRLILISSQGKILEIIGNGKLGSADGSYTQASFNNPHGTAWLNPDKIFLADTGNHSIRQIDLVEKTVSTIFSGLKVTEGDCNQNFSSPWDLCIGPKLASDFQHLDALYIAVAGSHQIWILYLTDCVISNMQYTTGTCIPFAGNGKEECRNNCYRMKAGFAQPSGITYSESDPEYLYIADSESSTIRSLSLQTGAVKTVVGGGLNPEDLFQFGDIDGCGINVKLQHPLAVCAVDAENIFIADSYNHKVKLINCKTKVCETFFIDNMEEKLNEPSGLCYLKYSHILLVSDTNNHCIKAVDLQKHAISKVELHLPEFCVDGEFSKSESKEMTKNCELIKLSPFRKRVDQLEPFTVCLNHSGEIHFYFKKETDELSLTDKSLQPWNITFKGDSEWKMSCKGANLFEVDIQPSLILKAIRASVTESSCEIEFNISITACDDVKKTCLSVREKNQIDYFIQKLWE